MKRLHRRVKEKSEKYGECVLEEIARQVKEGFVYGELNHSNGISFKWELEIEKWKNE